MKCVFLSPLSYTRSLLTSIYIALLWDQGLHISSYMCWPMKCLLVTFSSHLPFMLGTNSTFSERFHDKVIICHIPLGASHLRFINTWLLKNMTISFPVWRCFCREISRKRHREWKYFLVTRSMGEHNHRNLIGNGWKYQNHNNVKQWDKAI